MKKSKYVIYVEYGNVLVIRIIKYKFNTLLLSRLGIGKHYTISSLMTTSIVSIIMCVFASVRQTNFDIFFVNIRMCNFFYGRLSSPT